MFIYLIMHVMWHALEYLIDANKGFLILAPHFHLSKGGTW